LLYTANWPEKRITAWDALLKARAIENMSYCIGVNRIGLDGNGHQYLGHSAIYDSLGEQISSPDFEKAFVETITLHKKHIDTTRTQLQFLNDADRFTLM
jgi:predicted amidohydrolase